MNFYPNRKVFFRSAFRSVHISVQEKVPIFSDLNTNYLSKAFNFIYLVYDLSDLFTNQVSYYMIFFFLINFFFNLH